jgi:pimeloyl-ACP methyl ester carboxylesterase
MIKNLNYELIGKSGPAIVFLHGWGMNKDAFNNVISLFDNDQLILKLDFFSFGNSDDVEDYFDTYEYAYHVFLLLKKLNLDEVYLVGHSFGGRISIILSSVFDVNICGCMLTSSAGLNRFDIKKSIKIISYKIAKFLCRKKILPCKILRRFGSNDYKNLKVVFTKPK